MTQIVNFALVDAVLEESGRREKRLRRVRLSAAAAAGPDRVWHPSAHYRRLRTGVRARTPLCQAASACPGQDDAPAGRRGLRRQRVPSCRPSKRGEVPRAFRGPPCPHLRRAPGRRFLHRPHRLRRPPGTAAGPRDRGDPHRHPGRRHRPHRAVAADHQSAGPRQVSGHRAR
ncbi:hypothetical protein HEP83_01805 [Streptomyces sp. RLA2-12]|nr:hypothetical protein [Streptomyces sp. RLA2-12]